MTIPSGSESRERNCWRYQDAKPSDAVLTAERVGGIVLIVVGLIAFFS